ncbi:MAG: hypothetical protein WC615_04845 [Mucilaginibacter sp.]|jgi:hypothetical protein|uniref:hypothetical protein n=1 Tax=Mucilaginibacter sp. TaxID=1882438 RepID=UPI0035640F4E
MTYKELLQDSNWLLKRQVVFERDNFSCSHCNNKKVLENTYCGVLRYQSNYQESMIFNYIGIDNDKKIFRKPTIIKPSTSLLSVYKQPFIGYVDTESVNYKFAKVIAIKDSSVKFESTNPFFFLDPLLTEKLEASMKDLTQPFWRFVSGLHVHHSYYQKGRLPWEYPEESFQTLCWQCHENLHSNSKVPYLNEQGREIGLLTPCYKCHGAGYFPEYKHVQAGICFSCQGAKYVELIDKG